MMLIDDDDPDNFPYDNVEFPIRQPTKVANPGYYNPSAVRVQPSNTPDKAPLAPVAESLLEIDAIEADGQSVGHGINLTSTGTHSTVSFTTAKSSENGINFGVKPVAQESQHNNTTELNHTGVRGRTTSASPITKLKTSMVESESKQQIPLSNKNPTIVRSTETTTWPFGRNDFNPRSQNVLDDIFLNHTESFEDFNATIIKQGHALQKPLQLSKERLKQRLTYEQLLQGMLFDEERLLLDGHWVYFNKVEFVNEKGDNDIRPSLGNGRACLTNRRLLLLVSESSTDADLETINESNYKLSLSQRDDVVYISLPVHTFRSVEMGVSVGASACVKLTQWKKGCTGCFKKKKWTSSKIQSSSHNSRTVRMGVLLPPWNTQTVVIIHAHIDLPLTLMRDFVSFLQSYAPQLH